MFITGCSVAESHISRDLDEAELLLKQDPSAALESLNGYDLAQINDSGLMARWALLYSEALVANRYSAPNDTIVNIALDYYGRHNLEDEFLRATQLKSLLQGNSTSDALAEAKYIQKEKEFDLYRERVKHRYALLVGILILIILAGIIIWLRQRSRLQAARNELLISEAYDLKSQINESKNNVDRLELKLNGLLDNRFTLIDSLCQTYYESQGTQFCKKAIVEKVRQEIDSLRSESISGLEKAVNDCRDNLLVKVKEQYQDIKPEDYQLLIYLSCGFSVRTICLLLNESADVVYKRKSRLKHRLKEHVMPQFPSIMEIF